MSLPVFDNFNRANENPIGGNWSAIPNMAGSATLTNSAMTSPGYYYGSYWTADATNADCEVSFKMTYIDDNGPNLVLRGDFTFMNAYLLYIGTTEWFFIRVDGGGSSYFTPQTRTFVNGTVVKFRIIGSQLQAWFDGVMDPYTVTDATYTAGGYAGLLFQTANQIVDDFYLANANQLHQINIGDTWKYVSDVNINVGDVWKTATEMYINVGDTWKVIYK